MTGNLAGTWNFKTILLKRVSAKSIRFHCLVGLFNKRVYPQNWDANWDATIFFSVEIQKNWHSGYSAFAKSCVRLMQCRLLAFAEHMGSLWLSHTFRCRFCCVSGRVLSWRCVFCDTSATCFVFSVCSRCRACRSYGSLRLSLI